MKCLIALALVFPAWAWAVPTSLCPDNTHYYVTADGSSTCPPSITFVSTQPGSTTATITGNTDTANGTVYVSIRTNCTRVKWRDVIDSVGDVAAGTDASVGDGTFSVSITGLSDSTTYCAHVGQYSSTYKAARPKTLEFTTQPVGGASGETIAGGDDHFYCPASGDPAGSDANPGTNGAAPKATLPARTGYGSSFRSDEGLPAGADMWLCAGSVWNKQSLYITRSGSASNWSETGCFYMDGATAKKCVDAIEGAGSINEKPIFRGGLTQSCIDAGNCLFPTTPVPDEGYDNKYGSAIGIASTADYHHLQNIKLEKVRYSTVQLSGNNTQDSLNHVILENIDLSYAGWGSTIKMTNGVSNGIVRGSDWFGGNLCESMRRGGTSSDTSACSENGWPVGFLQIARKTRYVMAENNVVRDMFGEGISGFNCQTGGWMIIRGNKFVNTHSNAVYIDACPYIVAENNIILGGNGAHAGRSSFSNGPSFAGLSATKELRSYTSNSIGNVFRNNLIVGTNKCMTGDITLFDSTDLTNQYIGAVLYGNTCIQSASQELFLAEASAQVTEWDARNNLFWNNTLTAAQICSATSAATGGYNNYYNNAPSDADCTEASNINSAPGLAQSTMSYWTNLANVSGAGTVTWPSFADANPTLTANGQALTSGAYAAELDITNYGDLFSNMTNPPSEANWECALCLDATGATRASPPSIGAVE